MSRSLVNRRLAGEQVQLNALVPRDFAKRIRALATLRDESLGRVIEKAMLPELDRAVFASDSSLQSPPHFNEVKT